MYIVYITTHTCTCMLYIYKGNVLLKFPFQSALGWDHQSQLAQHASQTDAVKGFGGKFGVQKDRKDKVQCKATLWVFFLSFTAFSLSLPPSFSPSLSPSLSECPGLGPPITASSA